MSAAAASAIKKVYKAPRLGTKQVFLPNFTLTLLRTPQFPPTFASFLVPLNLNKLDLRDYLWNAYGIPVRGVRSYVQMQKLRQDKPGARRPSPRRWFRPRSIKKMMVEMEQPFVWPEEPENYDLWDKSTFDAANKERDHHEETFRPDWREKPSPERESIAEQAKKLLNGKRVNGKYNSSSMKSVDWDDEAEIVEVEKDVKI